MLLFRLRDEDVIRRDSESCVPNPPVYRTVDNECNFDALLVDMGYEMPAVRFPKFSPPYQA